MTRYPRFYSYYDILCAALCASSSCGGCSASKRADCRLPFCGRCCILCQTCSPVATTYSIVFSRSWLLIQSSISSGQVCCRRAWRAGHRWKMCLRVWAQDIRRCRQFWVFVGGLVFFSGQFSVWRRPSANVLEMVDWICTIVHTEPSLSLPLVQVEDDGCGLSV